MNLQSVLDACWNAHCSALFLKKNIDSMSVFLIYQVKISPEEVLGDKAASRDDVDPAVWQKVSHTQRIEKGEWWVPHGHVLVQIHQLARSQLHPMIVDIEPGKQHFQKWRTSHSNNLACGGWAMMACMFYTTESS